MYKLLRSKILKNGLFIYLGFDFKYLAILETKTVCHH
jgi:hypothetical protein